MCDDFERDGIVLIPQNDEDIIKFVELQIKNPDNIIAKIQSENTVSQMINSSKVTDCAERRCDYSTHCLICFDKITKSVDFFASNQNLSFNIFDEEYRSKSSKKLLWQILSEILEQDIKENVHSEYICHSCYEILIDWDNYNVKLRTITTVFRNTFLETCENLKKKKVVNVFVGEDLFNIKFKRRKTRGRRGLHTATETTLLSDLDKTCNMSENDEISMSSQSNSCYTSQDNDHIRILQSVNEDITKIKQKCDACNFCTYSNEEMTIHRNSHFCHICGVFLTLPKQMRTHLIKVHNFAKQFANQHTCNICHKKYSSNGSLHNHRKTIHGDASYTCNICGRSFRHARLLATHKVRHEEKKIKCTECEASFYFTPDLNKHINSVHRKVRPYQCPICHKFLCQRSALTHHLSQHANNIANTSLQESDHTPKENDISTFSTNASCSNVGQIQTNKKSTINLDQLISPMKKQDISHRKMQTSEKRNKLNQVPTDLLDIYETKNHILSNINHFDITPTINHMDIPVVSLNLTPIDDKSSEENDEVEINVDFINNDAIIPMMSTNIIKINSNKQPIFSNNDAYIPMSTNVIKINSNKPIQSKLRHDMELEEVVEQTAWTIQDQNPSEPREGQENKKLISLFVQGDEIYEDNFEANFFI